eukprot:33946-Chlamydomonas_euryale.AAC.1
MQHLHVAPRQHWALSPAGVDACAEAPGAIDEAGAMSFVGGSKLGRAARGDVAAGASAPSASPLWRAFRQSLAYSGRTASGMLVLATTGLPQQHLPHDVRSFFTGGGGGGGGGRAGAGGGGGRAGAGGVLECVAPCAETLAVAAAAAAAWVEACALPSVARALCAPVTVQMPPAADAAHNALHAARQPLSEPPAACAAAAVSCDSGDAGGRRLVTPLAVPAAPSDQRAR